MNNAKDFYLGLDIGTDSVGYAAADLQYKLMKFKGEPVWGVTVFDEGSLKAERRAFRTARRRLERRKQRVKLLQELFAPDIAKVDERFFTRMEGSYLLRSETEDAHIFFDDAGYTDQDYFRQYPTIHHLICELMSSTEPHDVRLVYLACAWLVAHRGHFLSNIRADNIDRLLDFREVYDRFMNFFIGSGLAAPWEEIDTEKFSEVLKEKASVNAKKRELNEVLLHGGKPSAEPREDFPYSQKEIITLLAGGSAMLSKLYGKDEYADYGSVSLGMDDDKLTEILGNIGDDFELIEMLRQLHDWAVLVDVLNGQHSISAAKVGVYEQHREDLRNLKHFIRKYCPEKYREMFREASTSKNNYARYAYHTDENDLSKFKKVKTQEEFNKYVKGIMDKVTPDAGDKAVYDEMMRRLELNLFMPKQKTSDNRVIPHQLYQNELHVILRNASAYLPFLKEKDADGLSVMAKIESIFRFRIPYFVGPLNEHSPFAWLERKAGKIYPWNFEDMVDFDRSEEAFIRRMTNQCSYLPGEPVLPKDSLIYHRFMVLNEINNLRINGLRVPAEVKQGIYNDLFMHKKKVTTKAVVNYLISNNIIRKGEEASVSGIDITIKSDLKPQIAFRRLMSSGSLSEDDVERIIERATYSDDKGRLRRWLEKNYPSLSDDDRKYICSVKVKDFGRLSRKFLTELQGVNTETGEVYTILQAMWETSNNLMELLSDKFTFREEIRKFTENYYTDHRMTLDQRLDDMYISNTVRRQIYRTLAICRDVRKAIGAPKKIFIEMARGTNGKKGQRTQSRKQMIQELYKQCRDEDVRLLEKELEDMGDSADSLLQGDKLFLYYIQFGRCMYSGEPIKLDQLKSEAYNIDHIYPQAYVKDDSIINNRVLVMSKINGNKQDVYPIEPSIQQKMRPTWDHLKRIGALSEEKYRRLIRTTGFTAEERYEFINRQLVETTQSTKAVAMLLKEIFPDTEIVYTKARLASEFRQEFGLLKSRNFNDLHHAVDAYLNVVVGNVYHSRFTKQWFLEKKDSEDAKKYSIKTKTLFNPEHTVTCRGETVWSPEMFRTVKKTAVKNTAHFTKYAFFKTGGLFDQQPVRKGSDLIPLKKGMPTEEYGGYNKSGVMFYIPVRYRDKKKHPVIIMSVELQYGKRFLKDEEFAKEYAVQRLKYTLGKTVDEISFPMGLRPWKVNTVLSLDGFRVCIAGTGNKGRSLVAQPIMQFSAAPCWNVYLKAIESLVRKSNEYDRYVYDERYDKVSVEKNRELYDLYIDKLQHSIYRKRVNNPVKTLVEGSERFDQLDVIEQAKVLLEIHKVFGKNSSGGCNLEAVGGKPKSAATVSFSSTISNWKKNYSDVRIVYSSPAGLWERTSENLLELVE